MLRLFPTNEIRTQIELDGMWEFAVLGTDEDRPANGYPYRLAVPGCWEAHPELAHYRGRGVYRRTFTLREPSHVRFVYKGVSHTADVYVDGCHLAHHYNAYTGFDAFAANLGAGEHELLVVVDNTFSERSALHVSNDYYTYGGLIRPVAMELINGAYLEYAHVTPLKPLEGGGWSATVRIAVRNAAGPDRSIHVRGDVAGASFEGRIGDIPSGQTRTAEWTVACREAEAWSPDNPSLFMLRTQLFEDGCQAPVDDLIERVGFRTVKVSGDQILLNGEPIFLKGFCRHEDHPLVGAAFPLQLMTHDLELMLDMGSNAVRTSHYPNDERFLDLCDERGVLVWEENHARGFPLSFMQNPNFERQCEDCNREMVLQHFNHPSIVIWGILNECASETEEGSAMYRKQFAQLRELDSSRPLTFASCKPFKDLTLDAVDIVSFNQYPGWYGDEDPGALTDKLKAWIDTAGGVGKPLIISEFGADGLYGYREPAIRPRGSEERQADILESNLIAYRNRPFINGTFIWQFCDCRVTEEPDPTGRLWPLTRAGALNNKGVVDRYRRPKLAYDTVKRFFPCLGSGK